MRFRKEIIESDRILNEASMNLHFSTVTPTNEQKVRSEFMKGKIKNPILKYPQVTGDLLMLRRKVSSINIEEKSAIDSFILEKQADIIRKIDMINSIGCFDFTQKSIRLYGLPNAKLVDKAYAVLQTPKVKLVSNKMKSKDAMALLRENFKKYDFKYRIIRDTLVGSCDVDTTKSKITLKKKKRFSKKYINKLVIHEIGTHVFRYENGRQNKLNIFSHGLADYLETEEGLALYVENLYDLRGSMHNSAGLVIAVNQAQMGDFYKTYKELNRFFNKKDAFRLALRAKRGLHDTSLAGGYTKDHLYFKGYYTVKNYISNGGRLQDLYYGKIGVKDVPYIKKLKLKKPKFLPKEFILAKEDEGTEIKKISSFKLKDKRRKSSFEAPQ